MDDVDIDTADKDGDLCPSDYLDVAGYKVCGIFRNKIGNNFLVVF